MKLCFPSEKYLQERNFEKHWRSRARLIKTRAEVLYQTCESLQDPQVKEAHLQSQEVITEKKLFMNCAKLI